MLFAGFNPAFTSVCLLQLLTENNCAFTRGTHLGRAESHVPDLDNAVADPQTCSYSVTKAAQLHLMKCLASVCGPKIRVNAVLPGLLLTDWVRLTLLLVVVGHWN